MGSGGNIAVTATGTWGIRTVLFYLFIFYFSYTHKCAYAHMGIEACGGLKRMLGPLESELQAVVSTQHGCWDPNSGPPKEECRLLTMDPYL